MLKKLFRRIALTLLILWFMLTLVVGMWVWSENSSPIVVSYFGFEFHDLALGTVMAAMFVAGFLLGAFPLCVTAVVRRSAHKRQINKLVKELAQYKSVSTKTDTATLSSIGSSQVDGLLVTDSDKLKLKA